MASPDSKQQLESNWYWQQHLIFIKDRYDQNLKALVRLDDERAIHQAQAECQFIEQLLGKDYLKTLRERSQTKE